MITPIKLSDFIKMIYPQSTFFLNELLGKKDLFPILNNIYIYDFCITQKRVKIVSILVGIQIEENQNIITVPKINFFKLIIGDKEDIENKYIIGLVESRVTENPFHSKLTISDIDLAFQFDNNLLISVDKNNKPIDEPFTIKSEVEISIDTDLNFSFNFLKNLSTKFAISDTGFIVEIKDLNFDFPKGKFDLTLKEASILTPQFLNESGIILPTLSLFDTTINSNGFSGIVSAYWDLKYVKQEENSEIKPFYYYDINKEEQPLAEFLGIAGGFEYISLTFVDNELVNSKIIGRLLIPYFDEPVDIELNIITGNDKLDFTITLKSEKQEGIELKKEELMALYMKSLSISKEGNSVALTVDGGIQPLLWNTDGLEWPRLDVEGLGIEQNLTPVEGKLKAPQIKFKEAWVDLKELATLDLFGFHFELNKIGMGYIEANNKIGEIDKPDQMWLEFTGSLKLMEQLPMGVAVEGFRLTWDTNLDDGVTPKIEVKFDGVRLSHSIPHTMEFDGFIKFIKEKQNVGFAGGMELRIPSTGLAIESNLLIGMNFKEPAYPYLYIQFGIELPAGIPLAQSGLALKGAEGLLGMNVEPSVDEEQTYYDWYKSEPEGMTSAMKWRDKRASFAFGAGVTITTIDGKTFGMQGLFALVLPGPIIMLEGKALIFDGIFPKSGAPKATAFFNGKEKNVQFNIETSMQFGGGVVDVNANIEAFFDFNNTSNWHLYIGKDIPKERRIHANILNIPNMGWLFEGNTYLMLSNNKAKMGMHIGFEPPLQNLTVASVKMYATLEGTGDLSINPFQFNGKLKLDALLDVKAFDILETTISAYAEVETKGVTPLTVDATIACKIDIPVPDLESIPVVGDMLSWFEEEVVELPDIASYIEFSVPFHWEHLEAPTVNPLIQDISVNSHFDQGEYTEDKDNPYISKGGSIIDPINVENSVVVPLDGKPNIVFDQNMNQTNDMKFGGFLDNGKNTFSAGDIEFTPTVTKIKVFKIKRGDLDSENWIEDENVWGLFRPENDLHNNYIPSRRVLQLWSNNPFEFVNGMVLNNESHSYVQQFIKQNGTFMFNPTEKPLIEEECIDIKEYQSEIVKIDNSYYRQYEAKGVIVREKNISENSWILYIHFPETVVRSKITLEKNSFKGIKLYRDSEKEFLFEKDEFGNAIKVLQKSIPCEQEIKSNVDIQTNRELEVIISCEEGFNCMQIEIQNSKNINKFCWMTKEEENKQKYWDSLIELNQKITKQKEEKTLDTDSYYKIKIDYTITSQDKEKNPKQEFYYNDEKTHEVSASKTVYFQTSKPSINLTRYIDKVLPSHEYQTFFYNDDIVIHFNRSYMQKLYPANSPYELILTIEDSSGRKIGSYKGEWKKSTSSFLLIQEKEWYKHINQNDTPTDDILVFKNLFSLQKQSRYNLKIKMGDKEVYSSRFMTSRFGSYKELLSSYKKEKLLQITTSLELTNLDGLEKSQSRVVESQKEYEENKNRYSCKAINKEKLEISKQKMITNRAEHDERFLEFLLTMKNIAYAQLPNELEVYSVLNGDEILGYLLRSPEPLVKTNLLSLKINNLDKPFILDGKGTVLFVYKIDREESSNILNFKIEDIEVKYNV